MAARTGQGCLSRLLIAMLQNKCAGAGPAHSTLEGNEVQAALASFTAMPLT